MPGVVSLESVLSHPAKDMDLSGAAMAVLISVLRGANAGDSLTPELVLACAAVAVGIGLTSR